jgi:penicillin G amidase
MLRRVGRYLLWAIGLAALGSVAVAVGVRVTLVRSLPTLDGTTRLAGLGAPVTIARDAYGVPTFTAASRVDLARAVGFVHAQERFFQMDLQRRQPAGELSALVGAATLPLDRRQRVHRFRAIARRALALAAPAERDEFTAYADGVNAGLASLGAAPFEYLMLRTSPEAWRAEDSMLVLLSMWSTLQGGQFDYERTLGSLADHVPGPLFEFLAGRATDWEAPIDGPPLDVPPVPGPDVFDLRRVRPPKAARSTPAPAPVPRLPWWVPLPPDEAATLGSNSWAVSGARSQTGSAIVANDMHLRLAVPNIWYRATFVLPDDRAPGRTRTISGVTLPGGPQMAVGTNGDIAWGFTNTGGDWSDVVIVDPVPGDPTRYQTPDGGRAFDATRESIAVRGESSVELDVRSTIWGPVVGQDHRGRDLVHKWVAHDASVLASDPGRVASARSVDDALRLAVGASLAEQNLVVGDRSGRIAWTIYGAVPRRIGFSGEVPTSWADGAHRWDGYLGYDEHPRVVDPPDGRLWTANARVVGGDMVAAIGDGGYADGIRAWMIRDDLQKRETVDERALFALQLDDRAVFLDRWRTLFLETLAPDTLSGQPARAEARRLVEATWTGRASPASPAYRLVRAFRLTAQRQAFDALTAQVRAMDPAFDYGMLRRLEGPLWRLVSERPLHLLDPDYSSWNDFFLDAIDTAIGPLAATGPLAERTWGEMNTADIAHPLASALPLLSRWLNMPRDPLAGDIYTPRVMAPRSGASQRLVVSPGHESQAILHMPGGQSGHPLSPHYDDQHTSWVTGVPLPLLPGAVLHTLTLLP